MAMINIEDFLYMTQEERNKLTNGSLTQQEIESIKARNLKALLRQKEYSVSGIFNDSRIELSTYNKVVEQNKILKDEITNLNLEIDFLNKVLNKILDK